jgi:hypothetical protein
MATSIVYDMRQAVDSANKSAVYYAYDSLRLLCSRNDALPGIVYSSANARAYFATTDDSSIEWDNAAVAETEWQIRRFHDVIEALQQKKKWPPLEATT